MTTHAAHRFVSHWITSTRAENKTQKSKRKRRNFLFHTHNTHEGFPRWTYDTAPGSLKRHHNWKEVRKSEEKIKAIYIIIRVIEMDRCLLSFPRAGCEIRKIAFDCRRIEKKKKGEKKKKRVDRVRHTRHGASEEDTHPSRVRDWRSDESNYGTKAKLREPPTNGRIGWREFVGCAHTRRRRYHQRRWAVEKSWEWVWHADAESAGRTSSFFASPSFSRLF